MDVTLLGIVIEVNSEQLQKEPSPMLVTVLGIVTEVNSEQLQKVPFPMLFTVYCTPSFMKEDGITMSPE